MTGSVSRLFVDKGFGFIATPGCASDYFFHGSMVEGTTFEHLHVGQLVEFEPDPWPSNKGPRAARVVVRPA